MPVGKRKWVTYMGPEAGEFWKSNSLLGCDSLQMATLIPAVPWLGFLHGCHNVENWPGFKKDLDLNDKPISNTFWELFTNKTFLKQKKELMEESLRKWGKDLNRFQQYKLNRFYWYVHIDMSSLFKKWIRVGCKQIVRHRTMWIWGAARLLCSPLCLKISQEARVWSKTEQNKPTARTTNGRIT